MTDNAERESFKKVLPCHPEVYWHETMKRWVTNGAYLLEAHAYNCQWEGFQSGRAVARAEEPVAWLTDDGGVAMASTVSRFGNANVFNIPLYTSPRLPADSVALREQVATQKDWVLVPREPTEKMIDAGESLNNTPFNSQPTKEIYRAMIAAISGSLPNDQR